MLEQAGLVVVENQQPLDGMISLPVSATSPQYAILVSSLCAASLSLTSVMNGDEYCVWPVSLV